MQVAYVAGAAISALITGILLVLLVWIVLIDNPVWMKLATIGIVSIPGGAAYWLARQSGISLKWLTISLVGTGAAGFVGYVAYLAATWDMD